VDDVGDRPANLLQISRRNAQIGALDIAGDEPELRLLFRDLQPQLAQETLPSLGRVQRLDHLTGLPIPNRLRPDDDHHLFDIGIVGRLPDGLLADESRTSGQQDTQPETPAVSPRRQSLGDLFLHLGQPPLDFPPLVRQSLVAEVVLLFLESEEGFRDLGDILFADRSRDDPGSPMPQASPVLHAPPRLLLGARHLDHATHHVTGVDIDDVIVAVISHQ
jgi:hypothetical protein